MESSTANNSEYVKLHDTYFRRAVIPITITCLVFALFVVIIKDNSADVFAGNNMNLFGGGGRGGVAAAVKKLLARR